MAISRKAEERALDADERDLVASSHHPALQDLPDAELSRLVGLVRDRRSKARDRAHQRRREMRGKSEARGATPSGRDDGSNAKLAVLAMAMRRLNSEQERRRRMAGKASLVEAAREALAMKEASLGSAPADFNSRHARTGMRSKANTRPDDLIRPMERGRLRKVASVAQARRDARPE